jgi:hypothetical protein
MPHVSLMYCSDAARKQLDAQAIVKELAYNAWPTEMQFDAVQIATPEPLSANWADLVNNDPSHPVPWRVIYTCPLGGKPPAPNGSLRKVVSGGQTGADTAGLRAAMQLGLETGGWCPPDGTNWYGLIPAEFLLTRTREERSPDAKNIARSMRTKRNAEDSDATIIFWPTGTPIDAKRDGGTLYTWWCAQSDGKPVEFFNPEPKDRSEVARAVQWLRTNKVATLNVAGPREGTSPCIGKKTYEFLLQVLPEVKSP